MSKFSCMVKVYLTGLFILVAAILFNLIASVLKVMSWYDFLTKVSEQGKKVFEQTSWLDFTWLFIFYPLLLGFTAWIAERFIK